MHSTTQMQKHEHKKAEVPDMSNKKAEKICAEEMKRPSFKSNKLICSSRKLILAETD